MRSRLFLAIVLASLGPGWVVPPQLASALAACAEPPCQPAPKGASETGDDTTPAEEKQSNCNFAYFANDTFRLVRPGPFTVQPLHFAWVLGEHASHFVVAIGPCVAPRGAVRPITSRAGWPIAQHAPPNARSCA